jgi:hypothetical protein
MGVIGKIKKMGKTVIKTTYENSGAQDAVGGVKHIAAETYHQAQDADKRIFGGNGLRSNIKTVTRLIEGKTVKGDSLRQPKNSPLHPKNGLLQPKNSPRQLQPKNYENRLLPPKK